MLSPLNRVMVILFFKSMREAGSDQEEPGADKMRRILQSHVDEARTDEERERAEKELAKFRESTPDPS